MKREGMVEIIYISFVLINLLLVGSMVHNYEEQIKKQQSRIVELEGAIYDEICPPVAREVI